MKRRVEFVVKRPGREKGRRAKSFSILRKVVNADGSAHYSVIRSPEIDTVNSLFQEETHDFQYCESRILEIKARLLSDENKAKPALTHNPKNLLLLDRYWKAAYSDRELVDPSSEYNALRRAVDALGNCGLLSDDQAKIQKAVDSHCRGDTNKYRRISQKLHQLTKHFGKPLRLKRKKEVYREPRYLSLEDFRKVAGEISDPTFKALCWVGFTTGCRVGEIFALSKDSFRSGVLFVHKQRDEAWELRDTKNRRARKSPVFEEGDEWLEKWFSLDADFKRDYRRKYSTKFSLWLKQACAKAGVTEITYHDLRHCFAKRLFNGGAKLEFVADAIGDDVKTARKYYIGWELSEDALGLLSKITRKTKLP